MTVTVTLLGLVGVVLDHGTDHFHHSDRDPDEVGRQNQGAEDHQPGLILQPPPQILKSIRVMELVPDGAITAAGQSRFDLSLHHLHMLTI